MIYKLHPPGINEMHSASRLPAPRPLVPRGGKPWLRLNEAIYPPLAFICSVNTPIPGNKMVIFLISSMWPFLLSKPGWLAS